VKRGFDVVENIKKVSKESDDDKLGMLGFEKNNKCLEVG
jgi:hypothetical protein